jgi:predicted RNA-binding protein with PIN domain
VTALADLPVALLEPLLDAAAEVLGETTPGELPLSLRPLSDFDRRGLTRGPARETLRRALDAEEHFRQNAIERLLSRPETKAALDAVGEIGIARAVERAAERDDLPLLVCGLLAGGLPGWEFGLGLAVASHEGHRERARRQSDVLAEQRRYSEVEEARRRAVLAVTDAEREVARLTEQLREDRGARRAELEAAQRATEDAQRRAARIETTLDDTRNQLREAEGRASREAKRSRDLEDDLRRVRRERDDARERLSGMESEGRASGAIDAADLRLLADASDAARRLAGALDDLVRRLDPQRSRPVGAGPSRPDAPEPRAPERRARPAMPGGLVADSPDALRAMLRTPTVVLIVDGYNVSKRAWEHAPLSDQRHRLCTALDAIHRRKGCDVVVVFDGDGSDAIAPLRRPGLQVLFSAPEEEADDVVVAQAAALPKRVPVVVASSDRWVKEHAEREGAVVVGADTLLAILP